MPDQRRQLALRQLAELGATYHLKRLSTEILSIVSEFPNLATATTEQLAPLLKNGRSPRPTSPTPQTNGTLKPRRRMSAAARAKMSARAKARWRAAKKAGKSTLQEAAAEK